MFNIHLKRVRCVRCKQALKIVNTFTNGKILSIPNYLVECNCFEYPVISGILYLKPNKVCQAACESLKRDDDSYVIKRLWHARKLITVALILIFPPHFINNLFTQLLKKPVYRYIGFKNVIKLLRWFTFPKAWCSYLVNRDCMPSYFLSLTTINLLHNTRSTVCDIGCGVGQLLSEFSRKAKPGNIYGIDKSFINLFLARLFWVPDNVLLICLDVNSGLPFADKSISLQTCNDGFYSIVNQTLLLKEIARVASRKGIIAFTHVLNNKNIEHGNAHGLNPNHLRRTLTKFGFNFIEVLSNEKLWKYLLNKDFSKQIISDSSKILKSNYAYNLFATKSKKLLSIKLNRQQYLKLDDTRLDYRLDMPLLRVMT